MSSMSGEDPTNGMARGTRASKYVGSVYPPLKLSLPSFDRRARRPCNLAAGAGSSAGASAARPIAEQRLRLSETLRCLGSGLPSPESPMRATWGSS